MGSDEQEPVYAESDIFQDGDPVSYVTINHFEKHVKNLEKDIEELIDDGYEIEYESW